MKALRRWEKWAFRVQPFAGAWFLMVLGVGSCFAQELARTDDAAAFAATKTITVPAVRSHMRFLSDGLLEGRDTGGRGHEIAAGFRQQRQQPPFWQSISTPAAFDKYEAERLAKAQAAIESLARVKGPRTIQNTLELFDTAVLQLEDGRSKAFLVQEAHTNLEFRDSGSAFLGKFDAALTALSLNRGVYEALAGLDVSNADSATQYYVRRRLLPFRLAGVDRSEADRERLQKLQEEFANVRTEFLRNLAEDQGVILVDPADLDGVPQDYLDIHKPSADGKVHVAIDITALLPIVKFAKSGSLRRRAFVAFNNIAYPKNREVLLHMLRLRYEIANLLGYPFWAEYYAASQMASSVETISRFIDTVAEAARPLAQRHLDILPAEKRKLEPDATEVPAEDFFFLEERLTQSAFGFDSAEIRPYLPISAVKRGLMDVAARFFGVSLRKEPGAAVWDPSVEVWDVLENGSMIGRVYLDLYRRPGKFGGAGTAETLPVVRAKLGTSWPETAVIAGFVSAGKSDPGLMDPGQVTTLFHEFGHAMHMVLSGSRAHWAGDSLLLRHLENDFIEVPSQLFEKFALLPAVLPSFAHHYQTGQSIPVELMNRMNKASGFGRGFTVSRDLSDVSLSLEFPRRDPATLNLEALVTELRERYDAVNPSLDVSHSFASFDILETYSSGYYFYDWGRVIVEDFFTQFSKEIPFAGEAPARYRRAVLEPGSAISANDLVKNFLGRAQNTAAFQAWLEEEFRYSQPTSSIPLERDPGLASGRGGVVVSVGL
jgi:thimet oligopeptidase